MKNLKNIAFIFSMAVVLPVFAHEGGHDVPGVLPPGSHGGKIVEAKSKVRAPSSHDELFFEVVYKDKRLSIYPKVLQASNANEFKDVSPQELGTVELEGENGRTKQSTKLKAEFVDKQIEADFELKGTNFGFVTVSVDHGGVRKTARAQVGKH